ncbi:thiamine phosphate synthase [Bartonella vinsonii]|uniref:Thiamine-phosphate pyrophosphorylase ThiE n=1 Tax=Bartonella vinsonii subsp. berkhoffii str. Tweed TaxID=1094502 RepID=N6US28_BARVB|nr:thiamine phosphate synthase [Bartonella vinsonii]ENN92968.1 thiamine-phosphate pyrophosphorylase ThiE [Bartonella vinsonii subsp. berkhoffii str. Tweed]
MTKQKNKPLESHPQTESYPQLVLTLDVRRSLDPELLRQLLKTPTSQTQSTQTQSLQIKSFACVILYDSQDDEAFLQKRAQIYGEDIQGNDIALLIAGDSRIARRIKTDGLHVEGDFSTLANLENQKKEQKIIGFGNVRNRHSAMLAGEAGVDYLLFGKLGADKKPHAHPRNVQLGQWWAEVMEIPAIVQAGSDFASFDEVLKTACEFIAVEEIIFTHDNPLIILEMMKEKCKNFPL